MLPLLKMKSLRTHDAVKKELEKIDKGLRDTFNRLMILVANGEPIALPRSRPMPSIGRGVHELRIKDTSGQYRVFYYTKLKNDILVFHFFKKKTQATPKKEIELAKRRLRTMKGELL